MTPSARSRTTVAPPAVELNPILTCRARIPQAVVFRSFANETVVLNLDTGIYHGLNPTGGSTLETLDRVGSVQEAANDLAREYDQPLEDIERDLCEFCQALADRGLLVLD